jgi:hypothetical protein
MLSPVVLTMSSDGGIDETLPDRLKLRQRSLLP